MKSVYKIKSLIFLWIAINSIVLISCKKYKAADEVIFLNANPVSIITNKLVEGGASNNITDLWVYTNGKFIGSYPVGSRIPIITNGNKVKINVEAGIKNNGIADTRLAYTFYDYLTIDTLLPKGSSINKPFVFKYNPNTKFDWHEDFDGAGYSLINSSSTQATITTISNIESLDDNYCLLELKNGATLAQVESSIGYSLPGGDPKVYLEFDYKTNNGFEVGLIGNGSNLKSALFINQKSEWNHIYVSLANSIGIEPVSPSYKIYFKMSKSVDAPNLYLDNIRLVHF